jgi:hypothetical protein
MAGERQASIEQMLNGSAAAPNPAPGPSSSPPPAPTAAPAPPARWSTPSPPSSGGTGSITYTGSALERFAQTSDGRASSFTRARGQAEHIQVSRDAFGYMFGALVYSAYEKQAQSVTSGLQSAATAMTAIASGIRESAARMHAANESIVHDLGHAGGGSGGGS